MTTTVVSDSEALTTILQEIVKVFRFITSPQIQSHLFLLKLAFLLFSVLFLVGIIYFLAKTDYLYAYYFISADDATTFKDFGVKKWLKKWNKIKKRAGKDAEVHQKLALIEAEKMLSDALLEMGYGEGPLDEKLKNLTAMDISNLEQLLLIHQLCQDIIHDPDYRLSREKTQEAVRVFEKTFNELLVL